MKKNSRFIKAIISYFILGIIFSSPIFSQGKSNFNDAMELYNNRHYQQARESFNAFALTEDIDENLIASSKYYAADCLLKIGLLNGAIQEFEYFVNKYRFSNFRADALFKLGTTYFELKDYPKVREKLLIVINEYPKYKNVGLSYYWIGQSYANQHKFIEAEEFLLEAVSMNRYGDKSDYTIYSLAYIYEQQGKYEDAVTYYDELLAYHLDSKLLPSAQFRIGGSYFKLKEYDRAILELKDPLIEKLPKKERTQAGYLLANSYFRLGQYKEAEKVFRDVLKRKSSGNIERELEYGIAWVKFQQEEYENAFKEFSKLSAKGIEDSITVKSLYWAGECKRYIGETSSAEKIYERFLKKYPTSSYSDGVRLSLGIIQYNRKKFKDSSRNLIVASYSNNVTYKGRALILLGEINLEYQNYREAELYFDKAVKLPGTSLAVSNEAILGLAVTQIYLNKYNDAIMNLTDLSMRNSDFKPRKVHFFLGEANFAIGVFRKAQQHYYRVDLGNDYIGKAALYGMAYSYFNLKDFGNSSYYFKEYLKKFKNYGNFVDAQLRLADSYFGMKNFKLANVEYEKYFEKYGDRKGNDYVLYQYGQSLFKSERSNDAIAIFNKLLRKYPKSKYCDETQYLIGWIYFQQNDFGLAISNYKEVIRKYPSSEIVPIAYYSIGDSYFNSEKYDSSIVYYLKIINDFPKTTFVYDAMNGIEYSYLALNKPDEAVALINSYIVKYPHLKNSDKILMKKGEIYYSYGDYKKAMNGYGELINFYPNSELVPEALYWMGKSALLLNSKEEAKEYFLEIINKHIISNYGIEATIELGKLYSEEKEFEKEIELYQSVLPKVATSPKAEELIFLKGVAFQKVKNESEAYKAFEEIIKYYDKTLFSDKAKIKIGIMEIENGRSANAEALLNEVAQNRSDDIGAMAQYYVGVARFEQKNYDTAISALVRVRTIFSNYDEWYTKSLLKLGDSYLKLKDKNNAKKLYRTVIKNHPRDRYGKEARKKLRKI